MFNSPWGRRLTITFPRLFLFKIFRPSYTFYTLAFLPTFLLSILEIYLIYLIASHLFKNKKIGLISSLLFSFYPLDTFVSTTIRGDTEMGFFATLTILFFILSDIFLSNKKISKNGKIFLILTGVSAALSYISKDFGLILMVFFLFAFILESIKNKKITWIYGLILLGFVFIYTLYGIYLWNKTGIFSKILKRDFYGTI